MKKDDAFAHATAQTNVCKARMHLVRNIFSLIFSFSLMLS